MKTIASHTNDVDRAGAERTSASGAFASATAPGPRDADAGIRFGEVALATGVRVAFAEAGAPDGDPIVFLHGVTDSWFSFSHALRALPPGLRAFAIDQRGHGDSDRPARGYAMSDFAAVRARSTSVRASRSGFDSRIASSSD